MINLRKQFVFCFILVLSLYLPVQAAHQPSEWNIEQLMQLLSKTQSARASFVETKSISMLDAPVRSSGELFYKAPDHFEKRTLNPKPESMVLEGNTLVLERGKKKRSLQLQNYPEIAAFIESIRGTLAGDRKALERTYQLDLQGSVQQWELLLKPIDSKMQKMVEHIRISGAENELHTIEITQADGDSSLMTIEQIEAQ
ncbi:MAG TPA: LolA-related protein [Methylophilaceae bacterium]|nr:LolA-related protein [Methylophilaceae bacterium]